MSRRLTLVALALVAGLVVLGGPMFSGATYVARTTNTLSTVTASADWTAPTVSLRNPGSPVKDTVTLTADAADGESGIASVAVQYLAPGASAWTAVCTVTTAPYSCSWATKGAVADGGYSLRAVATDRAGYTTTSAAVETTVANSTLVTLADPGDLVRGSVPLSATVFNAGTVTYAVRVEYAVTGTTTWRTLCTMTAGSGGQYTCAWGTTGAAFTQGASYDLRAVATAGGTSILSTTVADVMIDNVPPTTTMTDPGSPLRGTVTLAAAAADTDSGVSTVSLQWQRSGTTSWTTACSLSTDPFSCRFDTTTLADGSYSFRSVATDAAGNTTTSSAVANRLVDNTVSAVSMEDPGAFLSGTTTLSASASSTAGVTSVRIDRAPSGTTTWTPVCTDTTAPYSCSWDTTTVADGLYDLRAVLVDGKGTTTTSTTVSARRVDNSPLRGYDVQTVSGGAMAGRLDAGDALRLTYTDQVNPATVTSGWNGTALAVTVRLRDGNLLGLGARGDTVDVLRNGTPINLGAVNLKADYAKSNKTVTYNASMTLSTATVNGATVSVVSVTLGAVASGNGLRTSSTLAAMVWTPSALVADLTGQAASSAPVTELGTNDRDF